MQTLTTIEMDLPEPASDDNAERARHWHSLVQKHGRLTLEAAAHLGEVLIEQRDLCKLESKRGGSGWSQWCDDNLPFSRSSAIQYIKLAENWELVSALTSTEKPTSLREALKLVDESKAPRSISLVPPVGFTRLLCGRDGSRLFVMPHVDEGYYLRTFLSPPDERGHYEIQCDVRGVAAWWLGRNLVPVEVLGDPPYRDIKSTPQAANPHIAELGADTFEHGDIDRGVFRDF